MASHHCHHHFCHQPAAAVAAAGCSCCHLPACHQSPLQPHPHPYTYPDNTPQQHNPHIHERYFQERTETSTDPAVSALLRRITALEGALRRRPPYAAVHSLRDAAARTIQTHFRAFLVRRSRTLGKLELLASIKSKLVALRSSVLGRSTCDYGTAHRKTTALLFRAEGILGGGPVIRDAKSSVIRELDDLLHFLGYLLQRRSSGLSDGVKMVYYIWNLNNVTEWSRRRETENLRGLVERIRKLEDEIDDEESESMRNPEVLPRKDAISRLKGGGSLKSHGGFRPKVKKNVTFAKKDKVYRLLKRDGEQFLVEDCDESVDEDGVLVGFDQEMEGGISREIKEIGTSSKDDHEDEDNDLEAQSESGGSQSSGDGEKGFEKLYVKK